MLRTASGASRRAPPAGATAGAWPASTAAFAATARSATSRHKARMETVPLGLRWCGQDLDHVGADVANLFLGKGAAKRRHLVPARGHGANGGLQIPKCDERRASAVVALAVLAMTHDAGLLVQSLAGSRVRSSQSRARGWRHGRRRSWRRWCRRLARHGSARFGRRHRAVEAEQPHAVTARRADERAAGGEREHVLLAFVLERAHGRVHAGAGLELP